MYVYTRMNMCDIYFYSAYALKKAAAISDYYYIT